jgi:hypothetical protein
MDSLSPKEREDRIVYIYRQDPAIRNPQGEGHYLEKCAPPIDEEYIRDKWGGGQYLVVLKNLKLKEAERTKSIRIAGAAKIIEGQILVDRKTGEPLAQQPSAGGGQGSESVVRDVVRELTPLIQKQQHPDDFMDAGMEAVRKSMAGAIEIVTTVAKRNAERDSQPPKDPVAQLKESVEAMRALGLLHDQRNPMEEFKTMLATMKELRELTGESTPRRAGMVEELKGLAELLKTDSDGSIKNLLFRDRDDDSEGSSGGLGKFLADVIKARPDIIDTVAIGLSKIVSAIGAPVPAGVQVLAPAAPARTLAAAAPAPAYISPRAPAEPAVQVAEQPQPETHSRISEAAVLEGLLQAVVNGYKGNNDGTAVAISIKVLYPGAVPLMRQYMGYPDAMIIAFLRQQPIIAPIVDNEDFPEFLGEFKSALIADDAGEEEEEPEIEPAPGPQPVS